MRSARLLTVVGVSRVCVCPREVCASREGVLGVCTPPPPRTQRNAPRSRDRHPLDQDVDTPSPAVDRQTPVKTLPCPKLRLWAVNMICRLNRVPRMYSLCFGYGRLALSWSIILSVKVKGP